MAMIRINLLPIEARKADSTPLPRLLVTLGGTAMIGVLFFCILWVYLAAVPGQKSLKRTKETLLHQQQEVALKADQIEQRIHEYRSRAAAVKEIDGTRTLWAPQVDWLCELIPEDIWLTNLTVKEPALRSNKASESGPTVTLKAFCSSTDEARVASFLKTVQLHPLFARYYQSAEWTTVTKSETKTGEILGFSVSLIMKPLQPPGASKSKTAAPKASEASGA